MTTPRNADKWPKRIMPLTDEQLRIKDDFMKYWLTVLPRKYSILEEFDHGFPVRVAHRKGRVLEIGAGIGTHLEYEDLIGNEYVAVEFRPEVAEELRRRFPGVDVRIADCQRELPFPDGYFDRVLAIHVLEHLPDLPAALAQVHRILKSDGQFCVVIPCEGGLAYWLARKISAERLFKKRYKMPYDWFIRTEHINFPAEILEEIDQHFVIRSRSFFPLKIPSVQFNLVVGLVLSPRPVNTNR